MNFHRPHPLAFPLLWALVLGLVAFLCDFFGSMYLNPGSNIGPIMGFLLGPIGVVAGLVLGGLANVFRLDGRVHLRLLAASAVATVPGSLFLCIPDPAYVGTLLDAEVYSYQNSEDELPGALDLWEGYVEQSSPGQVTHVNWREAPATMIAESDGVLLELEVFAEWKLYEDRTPWSWGKLRAVPVADFVARDLYFARFAGPSHTDYPIGDRQLFAVHWEASRASPPDTLPSFLRTHVISKASPKQVLALHPQEE